MTMRLLVVVVLVSLAAAEGKDNTAQDEPVHDAMAAAAEALRRVRRVTGGEPVEAGEWPYLVHLKGKIPVSWFWGMATRHENFYCTGVVVNARWVLTAAHCFHPPNAPSNIKEAKYWHATVGEVNAEHTIVDRFISWFRRHPIYYKHLETIRIYGSYSTDDDWKHDLAMVRVEEELPLATNPTMGEVNLPDAVPPSWPEVGSQCIIKGWGCTTDGGRMSSVARAVALPIVEEFICRLRYGPISSTRLCAGYDSRGIGICPGDSGGPLVCRDPSGTWRLAGIASFTSARQPSQVPGVFTRITNYLTWIKAEAGM